MADTEKNTNSAYDKVKTIRDEMVTAILDSIEKNPTSWEKGWTAIDNTTPVNGRTEKAYRGFNSLYLYCVQSIKGYKDSRWVTFNQAKELGASVKKGEKSSPILFYQLYDKNTKKEFNLLTVRDMSDEEKKEYLKEHVRHILKYSTVFNADQCDNFPDRAELPKMSEEERARQNALIEQVIANSPAPVYYDGGNRAYYSPRLDSIHLPKIETFHTMQDYYATALHEIAHSTGHEGRLNRDMSGGFGSANYAIEELRAELACTFMQRELGISIDGAHFENHAAYLNSWLNAVKNDKRLFFEAVRDAEKISDYVAEHYLQAERSVKLETENTKEDTAEKLAQNAVDASQSHDKTLGEELAGKSVWIKIKLPENAVGGQYGENTLIRMPNGEYSYFGLFISSKYLKQDKDGKWQMAVGDKATYRINNDGRRVELTGQELSDCFAGKQIGKEPVRVAPSRKNAQALAAIERNVPAEMRALPNWCVYRTKENLEKGKRDKYILSALDGHWAKANEPQRWTDFDTAMKYARENNCEGLTFALDGKSGITCIDLDKCIDDQNGGKYNGIAEKLSAELKGTYTEKSVSGNGLHIFVKDDVLKNGKYKGMVTTPDGELEVYDTLHMISITGNMTSETNALTKCPVATLNYLRESLGEKQQAGQRQFKGVQSRYQSGSDIEVVERIRKSKRGAEFDALYSGKGLMGDKSRDDMRLAGILAFFTDGDAAQSLRIMKNSGLYRADKADSYYMHTIGKAIENLSVRPTFGAKVGAEAGKNKGKFGNGR